MWNQKAQDLWGLTEDEVNGQSLMNLDIGLPVAKLRATIRSCLAGEADHKEILLDATNRRGKAMKCRVACSPLLAHNKQRQGVILLMEEDENQLALKSRDSVA
jgi:two-component system CheB/CheR fusion protein